MQDAKDLRVIHDLLLASKPEEAKHIESECSFCNPELINKNSDEGGKVEENIQDKLEAAVAEATAPLIEQIKSLSAEKLTGDTAAAIAEAVAEKDSELAKVQADLDEKVLELSKAKAEAADVEAYLTGVATEAAEAARIEEAKASRLEAIKAVADFPQDHIDAHVDRWAAMDQADFDAMLEGWSLLSTPKAESKDDAAGTEESASFSQVRREASPTESKISSLSGILASSSK